MDIIHSSYRVRIVPSVFKFYLTLLPLFSNIEEVSKAINTTVVGLFPNKGK